MLDDAQRKVNAIEDKEERISARRAHERDLVLMQKERMQLDAKKGRADRKARRKETLDAVERLIDEISDEEEREVVRGLHRTNHHRMEEDE